MAQQYEAKPLTGSLFKAEKASDRHPDYTGKFVLGDGTEIRLSAWIQEAKSGKKYLSLKGSEPREEARPQETPRRKVADDDIPF